MSYSSGLQRQALFSIALVLFLFIMLINAALNFFLKRDKEAPANREVPNTPVNTSIPTRP